MAGRGEAGREYKRKRKREGPGALSETTDGTGDAGANGAEAAATRATDGGKAGKPSENQTTLA